MLSYSTIKQVMEFALDSILSWECFKFATIQSQSLAKSDRDCKVLTILTFLLLLTSKMESPIIGSNLNDFFEFFFIRIFLTFFSRNEVISAFIQIFEIRVEINLTVLKSGYSSLKLLACLVFRDH